MARELTSTREMGGVRLDNAHGSITDALAQEFVARPARGVVALTTVADGDEFNGVIAVVADIEYL